MTTAAVRIVGQFGRLAVPMLLSAIFGFCAIVGAWAQSTPPKRLAPTSSAELWERWLELLQETDAKISKQDFERVIGLTLPEVKEASGLTQNILSVPGDRLLIAVVSRDPKRSSRSAAIQWRPSFFGEGNDKCVPEAQAVKDLARIGWQRQPQGHHSQWWLSFRNGFSTGTYSSSAGVCRVSAGTCLYDALFNPLCSP